jgi:hypothetical protein
MIPASFDESNHVLGTPPSMTDEQCDPLSVFVDGNYVVSCWKLTADELEEFKRTGRIWLMVVGPTMPPVILTAIKPLRKR